MFAEILNIQNKKWRTYIRIVRGIPIINLFIRNANEIRFVNIIETIYKRRAFKRIDLCVTIMIASIKSVGVIQLW